MTSQETIPDLFQRQAEQAGSQISYYYPDNGKFTPVTWGEANTLSTELGMGLWQLGVRKGDRVAVISQTRHEWLLVDQAAMGIGGVVVSIYPSDTAEQARYILDHSEANTAVLEDSGQLAKLAQVREKLPGLKHVILIDAQGAPQGDWLSLDDLRQKGRELLAQSPDLPGQCREAVQPEDMASLVYTSGTTGQPKGVVLTHRNLYSVADALPKFFGLSEGEVAVIYLPMSHILQRVNMYIGARVGLVGYYAEEITKVVETCQAAQPTLLSGVPRVFEKIHASIVAGVAQSPPRRQALFDAALNTGRARSHYIRQKQAVPFLLGLRYALYDRLIFSKLRARLFGSRVNYLVSGAAPISIELLEFFHAIGLPIIEGYGLTETSSPITVNQQRDFKFGTVGRALPGSQIKIAEDGEILLKGPGVFSAYYKDPEGTREAFTEDGWFRTGDIGEVDGDGFLSITGRKKDIIITSGGKNIAPSYIENRIMNHPYISQVVLHGDRRNYMVALVTLAEEEVRQWAKSNGKGSLSMADLAQDDMIRAMIAEEFDIQNEQLASYETVKYFRVLPNEFSVEDGTLTPSLKVKRQEIEEKYRALLDEMYT